MKSKTSLWLCLAFGILLVAASVFGQPAASRVKHPERRFSNNQDKNNYNAQTGQQDGNLQTADTMMDMSGAMKGIIEKKESMKQAGMQMTNKMSNMMSSSLSGLQKNMNKNLHGASSMMHQMMGGMQKAGSTMSGQLKQGFKNSMGRMEGMQGMADSMINQAQGIFQTATEGAMAAGKQLHKTGDKIRDQISNGLQQNVQKASEIFSSLTGSLTNIPQAMTKNLGGAMSGLTDMVGKAAMSLTQSVGSLTSGAQRMVGGGGGGKKY